MAAACPNRVRAVDWDLGRYERIAADLEPVAAVVVEQAAPGRGERVLDIGCGTGNGALIAAERGALATGVDPAPGLLEIARALAATRGLEATFVAGTAEALPLADGVAEVVISVFGVVFAGDGPTAAAEMARVTAPGGRIVISAWIPEGAIASVARLRGEALAALSGGGARTPPFAWHDLACLEDAFTAHGFSIEVEQHELAFTAPSTTEFVEAELRDHPAWIAARAVLEPRGSFGAVRDRMAGILERANEDPAGFRTTSRYVVASMRRP
jgi:SAM-dependent methyltransferase